MDYKFDYKAAMQQLEDAIIINFMSSLAPDDETKKIIREAMTVFVKNGVPVDTAMKIVIELGNIIKKENNE